MNAIQIQMVSLLSGSTKRYHNKSGGGKGNSSNGSIGLNYNKRMKAVFNWQNTWSKIDIPVYTVQTENCDFKMEKATSFVWFINNEEIPTALLISCFFSLLPIFRRMKNVESFLFQYTIVTKVNLNW